jgi:hypothetical protein
MVGRPALDREVGVRIPAPQPRTSMIGRTYLERGHPVTVLARWKGNGPRNVLVKREDGRLVVRPFRGLRRTVGSGPEGV